MAVAALAVGAGPAQAATDAFGRTVSSGWGTADSGGSWTPDSGSAQFSVNGGMGRIALPTGGTNRAIFLSGTSVDWDVTVTAQLDRTPAGGNVFLYHEVRRSGTSSYRLQARFAPDGSTWVTGSRVAGSETAIGSAVRVSGVSYRTGLRLRAQATGASPTTLRIKAWPVGTTEPSAWAYTATDSAGPQGAGRAGLRAYASSATSNVPIVASVDDYAANAGSPPPPADPVIVGAGDIASGGNGDSSTAALLDNIPGTIFTLGDNDQGNGTLQEFRTYFDPTWGRHKSRILIPSVGNHEYNTSGASGYFDYFGSVAGERGKGYYSRNVGSWHVVVLNSNCTFVSCSASSAQVAWLKADLAANPAACTLAIWHAPRWSSGPHQPAVNTAPFWQALYDANADLVLNGHDHHYERFAPMAPSGAADAARGMRQIIVGTGGIGMNAFTSTAANSQYRDASSWGVLKLTLRASSYDWQFVRANGSNTDAGTGTCH
jgi:hypothetical protein